MAVEEATRWLALAAGDLLVAQRIAADDELPQRAACFHAQQAAEKALKALLVQLSIPFRKTHDLVLLREMLPLDFQISVDVEDLARLNPWAIEGRRRARPRSERGASDGHRR